MKAETKFDCEQEVFFVLYVYESIKNKCNECENGKIETTKGSILPCPLCFGEKEFFVEKETLKVSSGKIKSVDVVFQTRRGESLPPNISYWVDGVDLNTHDHPNEKRYHEQELFATEKEVIDHISYLEMSKCVEQHAKENGVENK
jgi:hypothetical protein